MLRALRVKDFAIIDEVNLELSEGFTVVTGETGAGKSILVDAIGLVTGARASADVLRDGSDEAVVEAIFEHTKDTDLTGKAATYGINTDDEILIRRNIYRSGKNRIYVNGTLSILSTLSDMCSGLVDLHGQHEQQNLLKKEMHIEYLDAFGRLAAQKNDVIGRYQYLHQQKNRLTRLKESIREKREKSEFLNYQLTEIRGAALRTGEDSELTSEKNILSNSQKLSALSDEAYHLLYENDRSVLLELSRIEENLTEIAGFDTKMKEVADMVSSSKVNLREASELIRRFRDDMSHDPDLLEKVEERLYLIERLKKKYGRSIEDILAYQSRIEKELTDLEYSDQDMAALEEDIDAVSREIEVRAAELSRAREDSASALQREVMSELSLLQMGNSRFVVNIDRIPLSQNGFDSVEFLIANMNEDPKPLSRVASGGELARLMLAIKCRLSSVDRVPTLIFDEVDAGIGGRVAEEVGRRLKYLSEHHQVCCVTHLPQIAALADTHYCVEKIESDDRVVTRIRKLNDKERVEEISRMLGGKDSTKTAMKYAEEMIKDVGDRNTQVTEHSTTPITAKVVSHK